MAFRPRFILSLIAGVLLMPMPLQAATAPWYKWQTPTRVVCMQHVNPKWHYTLIDGPYRDGTCQNKGRPG